MTKISFSDFSSSDYQVNSFYDSSSDRAEGRSNEEISKCPEKFSCTRLPGQSESVCCPTPEDSIVAEAQTEQEIFERQQSSKLTTNNVQVCKKLIVLSILVCEYLRDFSDRMEGTEVGMSLALKPPRCNADGSFVSMQCQLKRVALTKAEQKKVLEQNNIREMRKLLGSRRKREVQTLKLVRVDQNPENVNTEAQRVVDFLKKKIFESPEKFLTDLFGDYTESRSARLVDIQAEDFDTVDEDEARSDRKLSIKSQQKRNDLIEVDVEECYCVDGFGSEIPRTKGSMNVTESACNQVRDKLECLDLTCRMGCDYGFVLDYDTQCPTCSCRDPCDDITCDDSHECRSVEVSCEGEYCPPVPACFPKKQGQCPFLVPPAGVDVEDACAYECRSDNHCIGSKKCCSNGCGTVCIGE